MLQTFRYISFNILILSVIIYFIGRVMIKDLFSDDTADYFLWSGGISFVIFLVLSFMKVPRDGKKGLNIFFILAIMATGLFGIWGLLSQAGQEKYKEMDGLIPYYSFMLSFCLIGLFFLINLMWRFRKGK